MNQGGLSRDLVELVEGEMNQRICHRAPEGQMNHGGSSRDLVELVEGEVNQRIRHKAPRGHAMSAIERAMTGGFGGGGGVGLRSNNSKGACGMPKLEE